MSSRHREKHRERTRSRSPNVEERDRKHGRSNVRDRSKERTRSKRDDVKTETRRREDNDRINYEERRINHGSPDQRQLHEDTKEEISKTKEEPNFELSGKLTEYTNTYKGVVIKYNEPPEALKPKTRWRLYPFKGEKSMPVMYIHRQSAYLIGRQRHIVDLAVDHPSCSKQHAVLQYRLVSYEREDGTAGRKCKPYIIDLESANGTFLNNQKIEARRYYELKEKDVLKFGFSTREYVLLNEKSKVSEADEDDLSEEAEG
ncbi:smad nuclear-interacting protein 1-like [Dendronephthya gigantea]|uniref:smad nuclear-interacting protein 1-like n=1 Tax=Dendronephthya gigantea TaxID=151771 RepID=UPI00106B7D5F|nr:smad nuclear-interacting protein 1-like [Dendronephthya gigantea]